MRSSLAYSLIIAGLLGGGAAIVGMYKDHYASEVAGLTICISALVAAYALMWIAA